MDALGDLLAPYTDQIAKVAGTITCMQFLSGIVLLNDIRKIGSSDKFPPEPFIGGVVLSVLSLKMGALMDDMPMIMVNLIGFAISMLFSAVFYYYASSQFKTKIWSKIGIGAVFTLVCLSYASFENEEKIEFRFGMLITGILVFLVGSPLLRLGEIIEKKSTEGLPFPLIFTGTLVACSWATYGIAIKNPVVIYQNLFLLTLSAIQLALFAIYPNTPSKDAGSPSKKNKKKAQ